MSGQKGEPDSWREGHAGKGGHVPPLGTAPLSTQIQHAEKTAEGPGDLEREVLSVSASSFFIKAFTFPFSSAFLQ